MGLSMMASAERYGELITDLTAQRAVLGKPQMVGICRSTPANQAGLFGHELDVLFVTKAAWFRMRKPALVNAISLGLPGGPRRLLREA